MTVVVADASVLVVELLRDRGRDLFRHPDLNVLVAEEQWEEAEHELARRLDVLESRGLGEDRRRDLENEVQALLDDGAIDVVPRVNLALLEGSKLSVDGTSPSSCDTPKSLGDRGRQRPPGAAQATSSSVPPSGLRRTVS